MISSGNNTATLSIHVPTGHSMNTICQCNQLLGKPTRHPLASIINLLPGDSMPILHPGCYSLLVIVHGSKGEQLGQSSCDFTEAVLTAQIPGKTINLTERLESGQSARLLLFHQDLLVGTALGKNIQNYRFLKYRRDEALHLSCSEWYKINALLDDIDNELQWGTDSFTARILSGKINGLLDYTARFYHRQFITRHDALYYDERKINHIIDQWLMSNRIRLFGLPCICMLAKETGCSVSLFEDLVEFESGMDAEQYIRLRRIQLARQLLVKKDISDAQIALRLGFQSVTEFRALFRKVNGISTEEIRKCNKMIHKRKASTEAKS
jgi:AraC family transcriptional activator of pobA